MRRERWIATGLVATAVWIGMLSGCSKKPADNTSATTATTPATPAPAPATDTSATAGGAATGGLAGESGGPPVGEVSMALGEATVTKNCVLCHGPGGKGDGPGGAALNPKPRNWTDHTYMGTRTDDQLYEVIYNGKGAMPAWGKQGILKPNEIRSAIMKVRTFDPQYKAPAKG
jgi:mono/diheme cytochrome c family protein